MERLRPLGIIIKRVILFIWAYIQRFGRWWLATFKSQSGGRKIAFLSSSLLIGCCMCMCSAALLTPGANRTPEIEIAATESGRGNEVSVAEEATTVTVEQETNTPEPMDTVEVTETAQPSDTPKASDTPLPTSTTRPISTPSPEPTQVPTETQEPAATQTPAATQDPAPTQPPPTNTTAPVPTQPPPTNTAVPEPTQPPPTAPPAPSAIIIIGVNKQDEYVDIRNDGGTAQDLNGWRLVSERGNQECSLGGILEAGVTLRIWALAEDSGNGGFNCGFGSPIWNNSESDPAVLYDNNGNEVSRFPR